MPHTPGPWRVSLLADNVILAEVRWKECESTIMIAEVDALWKDGKPQYGANVRLIKASPTMLEALVSVERYLSNQEAAELQAKEATDGNVTMKECILDELRAAIKEATEVE